MPEHSTKGTAAKSNTTARGGSAIRSNTPEDHRRPEEPRPEEPRPPQAEHQDACLPRCGVKLGSLAGGFGAHRLGHAADEDRPADRAAGDDALGQVAENDELECHEHPRQRGERDAGGERGRDEHEAQNEEGMQHPQDRPARPGAHIRGRPRDRAGDEKPPKSAEPIFAIPAQPVRCSSGVAGR